MTAACEHGGLLLTRDPDVYDCLCGCGDQGETIRVRVTWTEAVCMEGTRELDAADLRRLGYDPASPASVQKYLNDGEDFEGDDWYAWHSEFADVGHRIDTDLAVIEDVTIIES